MDLDWVSVSMLTILAYKSNHQQPGINLDCYIFLQSLLQILASPYKILYFIKGQNRVVNLNKNLKLKIENQFCLKNNCIDLFTAI